MKILPIINYSNSKKTTFKGYYAPGSHGIDRFGRIVERCNNYGDNYYADPLEVVSDDIKKNAYHVIYDKEPHFPDINKEVSKCYFDAGNVDYAAVFDRYRSYFYRLEMADRKNVAKYENDYWNNVNPQESREKADYYKSRIADAQYNQETAATCSNIFKESQELLKQKEMHEKEAFLLENHKKALLNALEKSRFALERKKQMEKIINSKISTFESLNHAYIQLMDLLTETCNQNNKDMQSIKLEVDENTHVNSYEKNWLKYGSRTNSDWNKRLWKDAQGYNDHVVKEMNEINEKRTKSYAQLNDNMQTDNIFIVKKHTELQSHLDFIKARLEFYEQESNNCRVVISKLEQNITELPQKINKVIADKVKIDKSIAEIKAQLIPHFDKLKIYFYSRGLKIVR